jgi:3-deoxy-D-manno-octulosonate 8-phosphate phosphatase (KDO 8-P phosphatase)
MLRVGLALAPSDAYELVRAKADLVLEAAGGKGVAREVCDLIISSKMDLEKAYIKAMLPEFEDIKKP